MNASRTRVPVSIHSADPLTQAGVVSSLRCDPTVELLDEGREDAAPAGDEVAMVLTDRLSDGTEKRLRSLARDPRRRVVLVSDRLREAEMMRVIDSGVRVVVWRQQATPGRLVSAVHTAARGESLVPADLLARLLAETRRLYRSTVAEPGTRPADGLTARELDVLRLVANGMETREIAERLAYSERTVKSVLHGMMTRLRLRNRAHAVAYALREGHL
ncbi:response regulator transcription factor [Streptomyces alkaliterrae]|uniref:DNA-binding response regulator n=1 Tax=Streptomyces alkaliterrae TaxID=2213162 RepID=A0A5P0YNK3_9ACTN|nr:response regulator transcription factor [Streptomyces alkaliterrae]MBB1259572.1 response regulator transcription factor [Streptomyces alkaliterrae]MQS01002.1 DNA-binding response regulator [Streptomyces alkaliterrae]